MSGTAVANTVLVKPRFRGVVHLVGAVVALPAVALGVGHAGSDSAVVAALVYGLSLVFLLTTSAVYHTPNWTPRVRMWLRRVDHTAIYVLIAGSYTPMCLLVLPEGQGRILEARRFPCSLSIRARSSNTRPWTTARWGYTSARSTPVRFHNSTRASQFAGA
ncbi:MAG: hypothetical protein GY811_16925, partial [Myxococcales bacterium]|nr:hypothetical protein [Myxococcales bacterium]